jgi:hypothetical protein
VLAHLDLCDNQIGDTGAGYRFVGQLEQ